MANQPDDPKPQPLLSQGDSVEHFEIIRLLGRGGMGEVYLARDTKLSRKVALKIVRSKAFGDQRALERFLYEAKVTARFNHPHIVTAYSVGDHEGHPYVALEYLEGETLRRRMDRGHLTVAESLEYGRAIAAALAEAHDHKILHRDLKPENVVLPPDGRLRVLDFGLAKVVVNPEVAFTATTTESNAPTQDTLVRELAGAASADMADTHEQGFTGTPFYMAPEQWQAEPSTEATDIWGLGIILFEMLVGERPFKGPTIFVLGSRVISEDPAPALPPTEIPEAERLWPELAILVARCLDKEGAHRPAAAVVEDELRRLIDEGPRLGKAGRWRKGWVIPALLVVVVLLLALGVSIGLGSIVGEEASAPDSGQTTVMSDVDPEPNKGGTIFGRRMRSTRKLVRLGAAKVTRLRGSEVAPAVFWGLLHTGTDGNDVPVLVAERPQQDNGQAVPATGGGFEVTWRLRPELKWSDGRPLTARDLAFALEVNADPRVVDVSTPDARTVVVTWEDQATAALESIRPLPRHVLSAAYSEGRADAVFDALRDRPTPVVGPYRVGEFVMGERLVLEVNRHFVGEPPSIARVELSRADPEELIRRFEAGQLDVILPDAISIGQAQTLAERHPDAVHIRPSNVVLVLQPDLHDHELLKRALARRAVLQAIDRRVLASDVFGGEGRIAHAPTIGELPPGVEQYDYDPDAARAALERIDRSASRTLVLIHSDDETERRIAEHVEVDLEAVGLEVSRREVVQQELRTLFRSTRHGGLLLHSIYVSPRHSVLPFMTLTRDARGVDVSRSHSGFNERMASLVERERRALIPERRVQLRESLWTTYSRRLPSLPLVFAAERIVVHPALRGWEVPPGDRFGRGLEGWYFVRDSNGSARNQTGFNNDDP